MSYCVNCGVELAEGEKCCPLCQTEVQNPCLPRQEGRERPYPPVLDQLMRRIDRSYLAALISTFLLIPVAVTLISNWLSSGRISWSLYVLGAAALLEVWFILPLAAKRYHLLTFLALDGLALLLYLWVIERIVAADWFWPLAFPIALSVSLLVLATVYLSRQGRGRRLLFRLTAGLCCIGVLAIVIEIAVDMYCWQRCRLNWSLFVLGPCLILALALLILDSKYSLKEEIRKRMFY